MAATISRITRGDVLEFISVALAVVCMLTSPNPLQGMVIIALLAVGLGGWYLDRRLKSVRFVPHQDAVIQELRDLAETAATSIASVRSHQGESDNEQPYFDMIASRVLAKELGAFRRLIFLSPTRSTRKHLEWLVQVGARHQEFKVRYLTGRSAQFDFAIFDKAHAVLGFHQGSGEGFSGAVVVSDGRAIDGLSHAFETLWSEAIPLFSGSTSIDEAGSRAPKRRVKELCDEIGCPRIS